MNVSISPSRKISGEVIAPPSKSWTHRALFAGLLSNGTTVVHNPLSCDDTLATTKAVSSLGATLRSEKMTWYVESRGVLTESSGIIDCGESGVTLRFAIPIASLASNDVMLTGRESLMRRPLQPLVNTMRDLGSEVQANGAEVVVKGGLARGGTTRVPGNVSSQFISGLLYAAPLMPNGLELQITSELESRGYVSLTIEVLNRHGIRVETHDDMSSFHVPAAQTYRPAEHSIPGDYSSAAFLMSAAAVTGDRVRIKGLMKNDSDPDSAFLKLLTQMGVESKFSSDALEISPKGLKATKVDVKNCPDLGPILAVLGANGDGETEISGAGRLRYKESDRLATITSELKKLGANIEKTEGGLKVYGPCSLHGGTVESHGDHRIAMALTVAALTADSVVTIRGAQCVNKSYPTFFEDIRSLGVQVIER